MSRNNRYKDKDGFEDGFEDFSIGCCLFHIVFIFSFYAFITDLKEKNPDFDTIMMIMI